VTFGQALATMVTTLSEANLERTGVIYEVRVGDEHLDVNSSPPRIVIVPMHSQPKGPRMQNPLSGARAIAGELHVFQAQIWGKGPNDDTTTTGKDYVAVSTMRATFAKCMRDNFGTSFALLEGQWGSTNGESIEEDGRIFLQQFSIDQLDLDVVPLPVRVASVTTNTGVANPGEDWTDAPHFIQD